MFRTAGFGSSSRFLVLLLVSLLVLLLSHSPAPAEKSTKLFAEALKWMEAQFRALGRGAESRGLAVHLLSATQGVSVLAHAFHDPGLIESEAARLQDWIRSLEPGPSG